MEQRLFDIRFHSSIMHSRCPYCWYPGILMTYLLRLIASSADMSGTCIMVHVISHTFQWDDDIKKALQV